MPVPIEGTELPLWAMEIDTEKATSDFRASSAAGKGKVSCRIHLFLAEFASNCCIRIGRLQNF